MSVNTTLAGLSQTASSNGPDGTADPPSALDDAIRYALSFIAMLRDGVGNVSPNGFRLTLQSGAPVSTSDQTAASTIYACPYKGNQIALYTGSVWQVYSSSQFSLALSGLTAGRPYDVFCYSNSGTPTLEVLAWTSTTARATALTYQDGVLVKSGDATRRYLGTFHALTATTTEDSARQRLLWNYYHRVRREMRVVETASTWNYTVATARQVNNNTNNQLNYICGLVEDGVSFEARHAATNTGANVSIVTSIGLDSTTTSATGVLLGRVDIPVAGAVAQVTARLEDYAQLGYHSYVWLELSGASGTTTWQGTNTSSTGLTGSVMA
jgi:hypothetical protein